MMQSPSKSPSIHQRTVQAADDLVSVTVRKENPEQKAGISLVERQNAVYVTKIIENGLFHETEVEVGDKVLSINGKRLKPGEGARHIIKHISKARATVTMVVKKTGVTPSRGSRGGLVKKKPQRIFKKDLVRNEDGSLNADLDPRNLPTDDDDKDQIPIKAQKIFSRQPVGVILVDHKNMTFVVTICFDSIFRDSGLQIGDRVVGVNGMNFMAYADARMAMKQAEKSPKEVVFVVEKGHIDIPDEVKRNKSLEIPPTPKSPTKDNFIYDEEELDESFLTMTPTSNKINGAVSSTSPWKSPGRAPDSDSDESATARKPVDLMARVLGRQANGDSCTKNKSFFKSNAEGSPTTNESSHSNSFSNSASTPTGNRQRTVPALTTPTRRATAPAPIVRRSLKTNAPAKAQSSKITPPPVVSNDDDESSLDDDLVVAAKKALSPERKKAFESNILSSAMISKMRPDDYDGDYIRIKVEKNSERNPGIKVKKTEGWFILTDIPEHEKRINVGVRVLAINGVMNINTVVKADGLINETKGYVTLMIDFSSPFERVSPGNVKTEDVVSVPSATSNVSSGQGRNRGGSVPKRSPAVRSIAPPAQLTNGIKSDGGKKTVSSADESDSESELDSEFGSGSASSSSDDVSVSDDDDYGTTGRSINRPSSTSRRHEPGDKFMIRVTRTGKNGLGTNVGISLLDYKGDIYVGDVVFGGPFFATAMDVGDKLLTVNGKKVVDIKSASNAMDIIEGRETVSMFLMRPDKTSLEYMEVMKRAAQQ
jgi:C-terminal processing protease CtpA/Prc